VRAAARARRVLPNVLYVRVLRLPRMFILAMQLRPYLQPHIHHGVHHAYFSVLCQHHRDEQLLTLRKLFLRRVQHGPGGGANQQHLPLAKHHPEHRVRVRWQPNTVSRELLRGVAHHDGVGPRPLPRQRHSHAVSVGHAIEDALRDAHGDHHGFAVGLAIKYWYAL